MSTLTYCQFMEFARCRGNKEIDFHFPIIKILFDESYYTGTI